MSERGNPVLVALVFWLLVVFLLFVAVLLFL